MDNMVDDIAFIELELKNFVESLNIFDEYYNQEISEANKRLDNKFLELKKAYNYYSYILNKIENQDMKKRFQINYDLSKQALFNKSKSNFPDCDDLIYRLNTLNRRIEEVTIALSNKLKLFGKTKLKEELQNNEVVLKKIMTTLFQICRSAEYEYDIKVKKLKKDHEDRIHDFHRVYYKNALDTFNDELLNTIIKYRNFSNGYKSNFDFNNIPIENTNNNLIMGHLIPRWVNDFKANYVSYIEKKFGAKSTNELIKYLSTLYITIYRELGDTSFIIRYRDHNSKETASKIVNAYINSILLNLQSNKINFTLIDPVNLGHTFSNLLKLADYNSKIINERVWVEKEHIRERLALISRDIELIIQDYLRDEYENIISFNNQNGYIKEPYQFLVLSDFPSGFDDDMIEKLISIMNNGPRCGIHTILMHNESFNLDQQSMCLLNNLSQMDNITIKATGIFYNDNTSFDYHFDQNLLNINKNRLLETVGKLSNAQKEIIKNNCILNSSNIWNSNCSRFLSIPIGIRGANKIQYLEMGEKVTHHAFVTGATGSGKSVFLNTIIVNGSTIYSPDELNFYLIDFKEGIEFKPYADNKIPHVKVVSIESEIEFALNVLESLQEEMKLRGTLFKKSKSNVTEYSQYRELGFKLPRILLIIDEYQKLFEADDNYATESSLIINDLLNRGRAFGIHVILSSQAIRGTSYITSDVREQVGIRIAFKSLDGGNSGLADDNFIINTLTNNPGHGVYNNSFGNVVGNNVFQASYFSNNEKIKYLRESINKATTSNIQYKVKIFDGSSDIALTTSTEYAINHVIEGSSFVENDIVWVGEPVTMNNMLEIELVRETNNNIAIMGLSDKYIQSLIKLIMYSNLCTNKLNKLYIIDNMSKSIKNDFISMKEQYNDRIIYGKSSKFESYINDIHSELTRRMKYNEYSEEAIYIYILGTHKLKILENGEYDSDKEEMFEKFKSILEDGSEFGIFSISWSNNLRGFYRYLPSDFLNYFEHRIITRLSYDDSSEVIESGNGMNLKDGFAFYYDNVESKCKKFRIFNLEEYDWANWADEKCKGV